MGSRYSSGQNLLTHSRYLLIAPNILAVRHVGVQVGQVAAQEQHDMHKGVALEKRHHVFVDLSEFTDTDVSVSSMVNASMMQDNEAAELDSPRRLALFSHAGSVGFGIARMYAAFCEDKQNLNAVVFSDADDALRWLGASLTYAQVIALPEW
jgi:hypothetical protein